MPAPQRPTLERPGNCCVQLVVQLGRARLRDKIVFVLVFGLISTAILLYQHRFYGKQFVLQLEINHRENYNFEVEDEAILKVLQTLEEPIIDTDLYHIFKGNFSDNRTWEFNFSEISKRRFGRSYIEQTSYDSEGNNGDFFNPVEAAGGGLVLFQDYGPGIFERLLIFHRMNYKFSMDNVAFEVDGSELFSATVVSKNAYPFQIPFIRPNGMDNMAGYYVTFPVSYTKSLRIILKWKGSSSMNDEKLWNATVKCKIESAHCPISAYYSVISYKLAHGAKLKTSFNDYFPSESKNPETKLLSSVTAVLSEMAHAPEKFGPGMSSGCKLNCQKISPGSDVVLYSAENSAKVIQSLLLRLYDIKNGKIVISKNWKKVLITMTWDGKVSQVKGIPLAGFFTTGLDYLREVRSLTAGLRNMTCDIHGYRALEIKPKDWLAYLFYEMPFWKSARIAVRIANGYDSAIICSKISAKDLNVGQYHPRLTGYFNAQLNQQGFDIAHHKTMLHLENQWGHVVAINFFLRNDKIASTHELDVIIETDEANVPVFSGTGLEDFFHYVHDFQANSNKTSAFNGAPFYFRKHRFRILRCFRHMTLDPILFTTGIRIYLEASSNRKKSPVRRRFLPTTSSFNQTILRDSLFTVVLFYGGKGPGGITTDKVEYKDINQISSSKIQFSPPTVEIFPIHSMFENQPGIVFDKIVVSMKPGQRVKHTFDISKENVGIILRREYRSVVPNQKAEVKVNGENAGLWFCPQRALTKALSLRLNDYLLPPQKTVGKDSIEVTLVAITRWETISIQVLSVILSN